MRDDPSCESLRDSLVEVSLGIASGEERARVLAHVADCPACRRLLAQLSDATDELLQLAPVHEPPPGFELRVLAAIGATRRARRAKRGRWALRLAPALAAVLAAAGIAAGGVLVATRDERRLGQQLSTVLARAQGSYIAVTELRDARRHKRGVVFHYGGKPSWVFTTLDRPLPAGRYRATLVQKDGSAVDLGTFALGAGDRSLGSTVAIDLRQVTRLRLRHERDGTTYAADF
jgi:anti-sigma factor RsiW